MYIFNFLILALFCFFKCNSQELVKVGDFKNHYHDIAGEVFIKGESFWKTFVMTFEWIH